MNPAAILTGRVDDHGRPLVSLVVRHPVDAAHVELQALIDTGFTGSVLLPPAVAASLSLPRRVGTPVVLADGSFSAFETCELRVEWFGAVRDLIGYIAAGDRALIGLLLLEDCRLTIDYPARTVTLELYLTRPRMTPSQTSGTCA